MDKKKNKKNAWNIVFQEKESPRETELVNRQSESSSPPKTTADTAESTFQNNSMSSEDTQLREVPSFEDSKEVYIDFKTREGEEYISEG